MTWHEIDTLMPWEPNTMPALSGLVWSGDLCGGGGAADWGRGWSDRSVCLCVCVCVRMYGCVVCACGWMDSYLQSHVGGWVNEVGGAGYKEKITWFQGTNASTASAGTSSRTHPVKTASPENTHRGGSTKNMPCVMHDMHTYKCCVPYCTETAPFTSSVWLA